jgi:hypothetical protein
MPVVLDDPTGVDEEHFIESAQTFEEAGIITRDKGPA